MISAVRAAPVVIDTNVVLDLWVFAEPAAEPLRSALEERNLQWLATSAMEEELVRVLTYPQIEKSLAYHDRRAAEVLAKWSGLVHLRPVPPKALVTCKDRDDQKFIDLAVTHRAVLLSKDKAVLCMKKRLAALGVTARAAL